MRIASLFVATALLVSACTASGGEEIVVGAGQPDPPAESTSQPDATSEATAEPTRVPPDLCSLWVDLEVASELTRRATLFGAVDEELVDDWGYRHFVPLLEDFASVVPPRFVDFVSTLLALYEIERNNPEGLDQDEYEAFFLARGYDEDAVGLIALDLVGEFEERCGVVEDLERAELDDIEQLPAHVARVAAEVRLEPADAECVSGPEMLTLVEQWLPPLELGPGFGEDFAATCALDLVDGAMFVFRVFDVSAPVDNWDEIASLIDERPPSTYLGPPEAEVEPLPELQQRPKPEIAEPEPVEPPDPTPTPEVWSYPVDGLVLDVLGTLNIVGDAAGCMIDAGIYEPAELWLDTPGVDPQLLVDQRANLDKIAIGCGFTSDDVGEWLALGHSYIGDLFEG